LRLRSAMAFSASERGSLFELAMWDASSASIICGSMLRVNTVQEFQVDEAAKILSDGPTWLAPAEPTA
jgi:hypothetical protein